MRQRRRAHRLGRRRRGPELVAAVLVVTGLAGFGGSLVGASAAAGSPVGAVAGTPAGSQLRPGQVLAAGQTLTSPDGQVELTMQSDGNLVGYATVDGESRVLWASGTAGNPGAQSVMQTDGNLVVYSSNGSPLWSSGTAGHPGAMVTVQDDADIVVYDPTGNALWSSGTALDFVGPDEGSVLAPGQDLAPGEFLQSASGEYRLYQAPQGAPALYQQGADGLWWLMEGSDSLVSIPGIPTLFRCALCTGSAPVVAGSFLTLQGDGNLVVYPPGGGPAEWSAGVAGDGGVSLQLQDDGNLVLYGAASPAGGGPAVWQTGTNVFRGTVLGEGVDLRAGQFVLSPDGQFELTMQADGNLVVYGAGSAAALWASGTNGDRGAFVTMEDDDDLVVYGRPATGVYRGEATGSAGEGGSDVALWTSGTAVPGADPDAAYATVAAAPAFSATVPPPLIGANRALLAALIATNFFGQNTPAIAATEAQYAEMWAQDAAAMYNYAASSASSSTLPAYAAPSIRVTELNDAA